MTRSSIVLAVVLFLSGCNPRQDVVSREPARPDKWSPVVDSLASENRRLHDQISALATENESLKGKLTQLESERQGSAHPSVESPIAENRVPRQQPPVVVARKPASYDEAVAMVKSGKYLDGVESFRYLLSHGVDAGLITNCHYWMGEGMYGLKQYDQAAKEFQTVLDYEGTAKENDAKLMLGSSYLAIGKTEAGERILNDLISKAPDTPAAKKAKQRLTAAK
jgi:TolA-binding protein